MYKPKLGDIVVAKEKSTNRIGVVIEIAGKNSHVRLFNDPIGHEIYYPLRLVKPYKKTQLPEDK